MTNITVNGFCIRGADQSNHKQNIIIAFSTEIKDIPKMFFFANSIKIPIFTFSLFNMFKMYNLLAPSGALVVIMV